MERINNRFANLKIANEKAFVPYIVAGEAGFSHFKKQLLFLQQAGATIIEVGIPFSDPTADGPTIQVASQKALKNGITLRNVLNFLQEIKKELTIPIVIMSYFNPILQYGCKRFAKKLAEANIAGVIVPDLPIEEETVLVPHLINEKIALIRLVTVTNNDERLQQIMDRAEGFVYAVTTTGTTGSKSLFHNNFIPFLQRIKASSSVPVLAGFNITTTKDINNISKYCDGVIVGSRIIELFNDNKYCEIRQLIKNM